MLHVEGQPGIGKTRLLGAAKDQAVAAGIRVLSARGGALEGDYSYGVARQLFEAEVLRDASLLHGPAALASAALGAGEPSGDGPDSPFPVVHGLFWVASNLAERGPLALVVDDAHWIDGPTLRFIDYLAARLEGLAIAVVLAARPPVTASPVESLLNGIRTRADTVLVRPEPLGVTGASTLIRARMGCEPDAPFVNACHTASGGNPFMLGEMLAALAREEVPPVADSVARVEALGPETVEQSLRSRLAGLPPEATEVAEALSVFGSGAEVRHLESVIERGHARVGDAVDILTSAGILAGGHPIQFAHPVVEQAIYSRLAANARSRLHRRCADVLLEEQQPAIRIAPHLLACRPAADDTVVETLLAAASTALAQGAAEQAQRYLERAVAEPPLGATKAPVLALLGEAIALTGRDLDEACGHLEAAAELVAGEDGGAEYLEVAARVRLFQGDLEGAIQVLDRPFQRGAVDRETTLRLRAHQAGIGVLAPSIGRAAVDRLEQYAGVPGGTPAELAVLAEVAAARWLDGRIGEAAALAEQALGGGRLLAAEGPVSVAFSHCVHILFDADRYDIGSPALESGIDLARRQGSVLGLGSLIALRSVSSWRRGEIDGAETAALDALSMLERGGQPVAGPAQRGYLTLALLERGDMTGAARESDRSGISPRLLELTYFGTPFDARARLQLAQGRPEAALQTLMELESRDARLGIRHLSTPWRRTAVEVCLALGDRARAQAFAADQITLAARWDTPSAQGLALATAGLADETDEGLDLLEAGIAALAASPARLDLARAFVDFGAALRRRGRRSVAREPLRQALDLATRCGATVLATRAQAELAAAGARPRRHQISGPDALTASERRVARMAADGLSNREIAQALYITVRTVENHLSRAYAKLGITSRRGLVSVLAPKDEWPPLMT